MILKSTIFDKKKDVFSDIRNAEKSHFEAPYKLDYFNYPIPQLPESFNKPIKYKEFTLNLYKVTCTCNYYFQHAALYGENDIRCICKHLYFKLTEKAEKHLWNLTVLLLKNQFKFGIQYLYKDDIKDNVIYYGFRKASDWVNIYIIQAGKWQEFTYNFSSGRWSYNSFPSCSKEIEDRIKYLLVKGQNNGQN